MLPGGFADASIGNERFPSIHIHRSPFLSGSCQVGCMVKLMMETSGSFCWGVGMVSESLIMMLRDSSEEARDCIGVGGIVYVWLSWRWVKGDGGDSVKFRELMALLRLVYIGLDASTSG